MVALAVLAILLRVAVPNFSLLLVSNRLTSDINNFTALLNYARSVAITRNQLVIVCPKATSSNACSTATDWNPYELQAFVDVDADGDWSSGDVLLKTITALDVSSAPTSFVRGVGSGNLVFGTVGYAMAAQRLDIHAVKSGDSAYESKYGRSICVSVQGRALVIPYQGNC